MFKTDNNVIRDMAYKHSCSPEILEKTLRLTEILDYFSYANPFYHNLLLDGGPAINLTFFNLNRLFVGLSFDYCGDEANKEVIHRVLIEYMSSEGYYLSSNYHEDNGIAYYEFTYLCTEGKADRFNIDINYAYSDHICDAVASFKANDITNNGLIYTLDRRELMGKMFAALIHEIDQLAIYDISKILESNIFSQEDYEIISKSFVFYFCLNGSQFDLEESLNTFKGNLLNMRSFDYDSLSQLLINDEIFDVSVVATRIVELVNQMLYINDNEKKFIEDFRNGIYSPELLFEGEYLDRMRSNKMALEKLASR